MKIHYLGGFAVIALVAVQRILAGDVNYPAANPIFSFTVPDGYQCGESKSGVLGCSASSGFNVKFQPAKAGTKADLKGAVSEILKWQVSEAAAKDFKPGPVEEKNGKVIGRGECRYVSTDPNDPPTPYALTAVVFEMGGRLFQVTNTTTPAEAAKREADLKSIIDSIKPAGNSSTETKAKEPKTETQPKPEDEKKDAASDADEENASASGIGGGIMPKPSPSP